MVLPFVLDLIGDPVEEEQGLQRVEDAALVGLELLEADPLGL